ncbi:hypothetical protein C3K47_00505 [Solitalea longa]|uniref:Protein-glutamine gamma-glutamyltransferase-like C-terminal domain-containing protein n=1 Tax=Solitalea longa TaxID=2079460 RepID=A0A2S5A8X7_9SPHI|nr:DUF4129 domain-containing protein [Solitalea longa]POY39015.1 hypothetical protein C3K47_00505 [Solitalea longa]
MKKISKICSFILLNVLLLSNRLFATANAYVNDTTRLVPRLPARASIEKFAGDPDFQYQRDVAPPPNWWGKFLRWIGKWLDKLFGGLGYDNFWQYVFITIIILVAVWVILKLAGVRFTDLFQRKKVNVDLPYETVNEDVRKMDFDQLIGEALDRKNYRLAVRLYYLKALKQLDESGLIAWKPEKTNSCYMNELSSSHLKTDFQQMTMSFEYVWYGEFSLGEHDFNSIRGTFLAFQKQINGK